MTIVKRLKKPTIDEFIEAAPDSKIAQASGPKYVRKGKKIQITFTIKEKLLKSVDEMAAKLGQSRASVINFAIYQSLKNGLKIESNYDD